MVILFEWGNCSLNYDRFYMQHYKQYKQGVRWNAVEAISIQGLLALNQLLLFRVLPLEFYGLTGVIFSLIYVALPIINLGFDASLPTFIKKYITNKRTFLSLLMPQIYSQAGIILIVATLYTISLSMANTAWFSSIHLMHVPSTFFILLTSIIIVESIKKSLRALTHACFLNKQTTFIELSSVALYILLVWGNYLVHGTLTLWTIFIPLLIESCLASLGLAILIKRKTYNELPSNTKKSEQLNMTRVYANRFSAYTNQLSMIFFSRNFLIPFLSWQFGLGAIAILKLISELAIFVLVFIEKLFGTTGGALLAHLKFESLAKKRAAFTLIAQQLVGVLLAILIFLAFNGKTIFCLYCGPISNYYLAFLFFFTIIFENIFLLYERFALIEEKVRLTILLNLLSAGLCFPLILLLQSSLPLSIVIIALTRIVAFIILSFIYYRYWKLPQRIRIITPFVVTVFVVSLVLSYALG